MRTRVYVANMVSDARQEGLKDLLASEVKGATLTYGEGLWEGTWEPATVIEVMQATFTSMLWVNWVTLYAKALGEDSVYVTVEESDGIQAYLVYEDTGGTVRWDRG